MFSTAFSTVACPEWTLERVAAAAPAFGCDGVELRTFGYGSTQVACDPALTAPAKTRAMFAAAGVRIASLATGARFDEPITPPVLGRVIGDNETAVRQAKAALDLAAQVEAPFIRVFAFEQPAYEPRRRAVPRIVERLRLVADAARNTGVTVLLENGGSFPKAADLLELIERVGSPLLAAAYSAPVAWNAGENPAEGVRVLGDRLRIAKLKDYARGRLCPLGAGEVPSREFVRSLAGASFEGWLVLEWDRLWFPDLAAPEDVLPAAFRSIYEWAGGGSAFSRAPRAPQHA